MQKVALPIAEEMVALAKQLETLGQAEAPWLQQVIQHWHQAPGKQIRPQCVFLVAGACGKISPKAHRAAALAALLHQASLVHDDVVDEATHRRGHPTVHARWGNKVAVLFGDHLLAKALSLVTQHQDYDLLQCLTEATQAMTQGELLQLSQAHQPETSEQVYLDIIHQKTAHLFGACFAMGALTAKVEEAQVTTLRQAGLHLGMAFQIRDDLNDYRAAEEGKPTGMDIREGKLTLPLIYALQQADAPTRQSIQTMIASSKPLSPEALQTIIHFVQRSPGMDDAQRQVRQYCQAALQGLHVLQKGPYKAALQALIQWLAR